MQFQPGKVLVVGALSVIRKSSRTLAWSSNLYVGVDHVEDLEAGGEVLKLAEPEVAVVPGGGEADPPQRPHDPHLPHGDVPHVVPAQVQVLQSEPRSW